MRLWLFRRWDQLRTNYWFVPLILAIIAVALALLTPQLDRYATEKLDFKLDWTYSGGPEGARGVLSTIAGSMITVAGVVFSITIVALSLASGQFGPRLLRNFIRDRSNQFVLGTFTATFLYCLLILRTVRGTDYHEFVPSFSVTLGIILAVIDLCVLIYFIHHVAVSIQASQVVAVVTQELHETIDRLWPEDLGEEGWETKPQEEIGLPADLADNSSPVAAESSGYVDMIADDELLKLAVERDLVLKLTFRPGNFVVKGSPLVRVWPADKLDDELSKRINGVFTLSPHRTPFQDVEFAVDQLVEIAVRALSPGINDPFTAMACLDRLGEALSRLTERTVPSPYRYDEEDRLRIVARPARFESVVDSAFHQIRQYGRTSASVLIRMLETIAVVANHATREEDLAALAKHAELVHKAATQGIPEESDRLDLDERYEAVHAALRGEDENGKHADAKRRVKA